MPTVSIRDIEVYYEERGRPDGEPLLLLHGMLHTAESAFGADVAALGEQYRLIMPDARGHGRSTNPRGVFSFAELAQDTAALLDTLGLRRCHCLGYSLGAMQLLVLAQRRPDLIGTLMVVGGAHELSETARNVVAQIRANPSPALVRLLEERHEPFQGAGYGRRLLDTWWNLAASGELALTPGELGPIAAPTLLLFGDRDPFFPVAVPLTMYEALPNAELCIVPDCGHIVNYASPTLFRLVVLDFLQRHPLGE